MSVSESIAEQRFGEMVKTKQLLSGTKDMDLWRAMIANEKRYIEEKEQGKVKGETKKTSTFSFRSGINS